MGESRVRRERGDAPRTVYELRVELVGSDPPIRRRVRVAGDATLAELHQVIQAVMPWDNSHLHRFRVGGVSYAPPEWDVAERDERTARLRRVAPRVGDVFTYEYDFGDSWEHEILVEAIEAPRPGERDPVCVAGERAAPPDDSGGLWGYYDWLDALADPADPRHEDARAWLGEDFDPEAFDVARANQRLARLGGGVWPGSVAGGGGAGGGATTAGPGQGVEGVARDDDVGPGSSAESGRGPHAPRISALQAGIRAMARQVVQEALDANPHATLDDLNAALARRVARYNQTPQRELGGLSPSQVRALIDDDWEGNGPVRLNAALSLDDLAGSRTLANARAFLGLLVDRDGLGATTTGSLNRAAVAALLERIELPGTIFDELPPDRKVINEGDVRALHHLRVVLELAGLVRRRKGAFQATRKARELLEPGRAGELFTLLFRTHFRTFNLAYVDRAPEAPGFQRTIAFSMHRFARVGGEWARPEELVDRLVLPAVRDELPVRTLRFGQDAVAWDDLAIIIETRLLRPLAGFGLAESREVRVDGSVLPHYAYRKSPLFDRFLQFEPG